MQTGAVNLCYAYSRSLRIRRPPVPCCPEYMQTIGKHQVEIEGDTLLVRWVGIPSLAELQQVGALNEQVIAQQGRVFYVMDMRQAGVPSPEARSYLRSWAVGKPIIGPVVFGMSLPIRAILTMILRGMQLKNKYKRFESAFVKDETEARSWVAKVRARRQAEETSEQ